MKTYYFDDYGAMFNGAFDCNEVWNKIIADIDVSDAIIEFGSGTYLFKNMITLNLNEKKSEGKSQSITIRGQGKGVTNLLWSDGDSSGLSMSHYDSDQDQCRYNIYDMSFLTTNKGKGIAIKLENKNPYKFGGGYLSMRGVLISGVGGQSSGDFGWEECLSMTTISFNNIVDCDFIGCIHPESNDSNNKNSYGVVIKSTQINNQTLSSIVTNFTNCIFLYLSCGVNSGVGSQGVTVSQCNFTNNLYGIILDGVGYQLSVMSSQFDNFAMSIKTGGLSAFFFIGNLVFVAHKDNFGIFSEGYIDGYTVTNNQFVGGGKDLNTNGVVITGNSFENLSTSIVCNNLFKQLTTGIWLKDQTAGISVSGNLYADTYNKCFNQGKNNIIKD